MKTMGPVLGNKLMEATAYTQNQKLYLSAFPDHGKVDIFNYFAENAIPPFHVPVHLIK